MARRLIAIFSTLTLSLTAIAAAAQEWNPLVTPQDVVGLMGKVDLLDIRLLRGDKGYAAGHINASVSAPYPLFRGPKENPGQRLLDGELSMLLRAKGLTKRKPVVIVYEGANPANFGAAARVYWTL